jgi:hypothetical protein
MGGSDWYEVLGDVVGERNVLMWWWRGCEWVGRNGSRYFDDCQVSI